MRVFLLLSVLLLFSSIGLANSHPNADAHEASNINPDESRTGPPPLPTRPPPGPAPKVDQEWLERALQKILNLPKPPHLDLEPLQKHLQMIRNRPKPGRPSSRFGELLASSRILLEEVGRSQEHDHTIRLLIVETFPERYLVRIESTIRHFPETGEDRYLRESAVLADEIVVVVHEGVTVDQFVAYGQEHGNHFVATRIDDLTGVSRSYSLKYSEVDLDTVTEGERLMDEAPDLVRWTRPVYISKAGPDYLIRFFYVSGFGNGVLFDGVLGENDISIDSTVSSSDGTRQRFWEAGEDVGGGWRRLEWTGYLFTERDPSLYHESHGWIYSLSEREDDVWYHDFHPEMGWLWTGRPVYPFLYRVRDDSWLWFDRDSVEERWLFNFRSQSWEYLLIEKPDGASQSTESVAESSSANFWTTGTDLGGGWRALEWQSAVYVEQFPFVFHSVHGWIYSESMHENDVWYHDSDLEMGWLWTNRTVYPFLYRVRDDAWLWFNRDSAEARWLFNFRSKSWEHLPRTAP